MTMENIPHFLPSQQGMENNDIVVDCFEKIKALTSLFLESTDQNMLHQYSTLIDDLAEIGIFHAISN